MRHPHDSTMIDILAFLKKNVTSDLFSEIERQVLDKIYETKEDDLSNPLHMANEYRDAWELAKMNPF